MKAYNRRQFAGVLTLALAGCGTSALKNTMSTYDPALDKYPNAHDLPRDNRPKLISSDLYISSENPLNFMNEPGYSIVRALIDTDGKVEKVELMKRGIKFYDSRLLQIMRNFIYVPATKNGKPIKAWTWRIVNANQSDNIIDRFFR